MRKQSLQKRIGVLALCLLLAVFWFGASYLAATHTGHDCCRPSNCSVCLQITANRFFMQGALRLCFLAALLGLTASFAAHSGRALPLPPFSLITQKIKLSC